ncbi:glycoside hydrolase family 2 protein [uncultured Sphaerochaeta sp.]|uniref:beta-mannosidase n=1 Tax=uncultured Sphaerochaeta sp. TaxID=886478 RepID=UPI002A0A6065|nr:glycoside hydrolase family 2 protein [uncultured Sphaerochaeta sp.]
MQTINLNGQWRLSPNDKKAIGPFCTYFLTSPSIPCTLPGDVHSALLEQQLIPDPYFGTNELQVQWVGKQDWNLTKVFSVTKEQMESGMPVLTLTMADTIIKVLVNGEEAGTCNNQFRRFRFDLSPWLREGDNTMELQFFSAEAVAMQEAEKLSYPIPYSVYPVSAKHRNLIRKTQSHSGWDWGPCIMSFGIYEDILLDFIDEGIVESIVTDTTPISEKTWEVTVTVVFNAPQNRSLPCSITVGKDAGSQKGNANVTTGLNKLSFHLMCTDIERWWPNGEGKPTLYRLTVAIGDQTFVKRIGFRTLTVKTVEDEQGGKGMTFCVNGREVFAKGANWIPLDALVSRFSDQRYEQLLQGCVDANMNMIRLWGGGLYEKEAFYDYCDEKGLMIWHDCMFSCSMYPSNPAFLANVEAELRYQIPRLQDHASIALWCGNNEDLGAIGWYEETKNNPIRYVIDYDRLNEGTVGRVIRELDPNRTWWPSSPSAGIDDFSDNWHNDSRGDMHFWSVWHEGKPFEAYYSIKPRFVSEFGYQSFPSLSTVKLYAPDEQLNLTSPIMEHHQKNDRGNSIIIENFSRYFRFPSSFEQMLYLSQAQQAMAIKTAVEFWRTLRPHCMGAIFWQLNDNWPVASWSSIDYTGKWKLLQYAAMHFYSPIMPIAYLTEDGKMEVFVVNDRPRPLLDAKLSIQFCHFTGEKLNKQEYFQDFPAQSSTHVCTIDPKTQFKAEAQDSFAYIKLVSSEIYRENCLFLDRPKRCTIINPELNLSIARAPEGFSVTVSCQAPAFFVSLDAGNLKGNFTDNFFDIRPTAQKVVVFKTKEKISIKQFRDLLVIYDLYGSSH